jgi:hypothetical protein
MDSRLRGSILFAREVYYGLKECEICLLERIEESNMRQVLKMSRGFPITQIYQIPTRFQIKKDDIIIFEGYTASKY